MQVVCDVVCGWMKEKGRWMREMKERRSLIAGGATDKLIAKVG